MLILPRVSHLSIIKVGSPWRLHPSMTLSQQSYPDMNQSNNIDDSDSEFEGFPDSLQNLSKRLRLQAASTASAQHDGSKPSENSTLPDETDFDSSEEAKRCHLCLEINPHKTPFMAKCDSCKFWSHLSCANITGRQANSLTIWHCAKCLSPDNITDIPNLNPASIVPQDMAGQLAIMRKTVKLYKRLPKSICSTRAGIEK